MSPGVQSRDDIPVWPRSASLPAFRSGVEQQLHQQLFAEGVDEVRWRRKRLAHGGSRHVRGRSRPSPHPCNWVSKLAIRIRRRAALPASARSGRARSAVVPRLWSACRQSTSQACAAPTVSAILAPRLPIGLGCPMVLSWAVWCSISALSLAPSRTTMIEIQIQVMKPTTAPSEP